MKAGRIIALLMGLTLMALLLPMQATADDAAPGIVMGGGAVTKGSVRNLPAIRHSGNQGLILLYEDPTPADPVDSAGKRHLYEKQA